MPPNQTNPNLWVVIPTYNRSNDLLACLGSLVSARINLEQVVIVDNHSQDETVSMVRAKHPKTHLISLNENLGATGAANIGFDFALERGADYVLRQDSDTIVDENFIEPLLVVGESDPTIGVISPKIYYFDPPDEIWYAGVDSQPLIFGTTNEHRHEKDRPENSQQREVDYIWAASMLIKSEVLRKTGGFDTDFFVYHEEINFCERVKQLGYKLIYIPKSYVWHKVGSSANNAWTAYHWNRSKMLLYRKHARNVIHLCFLVCYAYVYTIWSALFAKTKAGNRGPFNSALKGLMRGLTKKLSKDQNKSL